MTRRVAIYARTSSDLQRPTSITDQIAMARRFCEREGWVVTETDLDEEKTGRHASRPGLQALKAAADVRRFDVVFVEAIDRLTPTAPALRALAFHGIDLHSIAERPQDFLRVMRAAFGAWSTSEMISAQTLHRGGATRPRPWPRLRRRPAGGRRGAEPRGRP